MDMKPHSSESQLTRFVGLLTIALGVGMLIPRNVPGLYALVVASGAQAAYVTMTIGVGVGLASVSYLPYWRARVTMHILGAVVWAIILSRFYAASLWGAVIQSCVILHMLCMCGFRLYRAHRQ